MKNLIIYQIVYSDSKTDRGIVHVESTHTLNQRIQLTLYSLDIVIIIILYVQSRDRPRDLLQGPHWLG